MKLEEELAKQFGSACPRLTDVAKYFLNMEEDAARDNAAKGTIPFKIFKASKSQKAPWLTHVRELANYLEEQCRK